MTMAAAQVPFDKRLHRIVRKHQRMQHGVTYKIDHSGMIVARPRLYNPKFPLKGLLIVLATAFALKGYMLASLGAGVYDDKVALLQQGTAVEKIGAWVMQSDPATEFVAARLADIGV